MNIIIDNFKTDLDRLIDNSITITSNERKDLVDKITEIVFAYDARYTILNEMEEYLKGGEVDYEGRVGNIWEKRKCFICGEKFKQGELITALFTKNRGNKLSCSMCYQKNKKGEEN